MCCFRLCFCVFMLVKMGYYTLGMAQVVFKNLVIDLHYCFYKLFMEVQYTYRKVHKP